MSSTMLLGVLRMPTEMWSGDAVDVMQRHGRYIQAADRIEELEHALTQVLELSNRDSEHFGGKRSDIAELTKETLNR